MSESELRSAVRALGSAVVAYSGGVDSAVVLAVCAQELGASALGVTGVSASMARGELEAAIAVARGIGARHETLETREFAEAKYRANERDRCYHCKHELFSRLRSLADERGIAHVVDGFNADDGITALDVRPGRGAARAFGVRSPLAEAGFTKSDVRALAKKLGLSVWEKPATPCLSSRVPYGTRIEEDDLRRIDLAESYLRASGFPVVRVRHYGSIARVEVPIADLTRLSEMRSRVERAFADVGYLRLEIDARGYRTGSLNE
jgi:pyridinium-3,5-biscarboxylic acid mononucleotide sulfurtransferase